MSGARADTDAATRTEARRAARSARRLVVKVGSGVLTEEGRIRPRIVGELARQVAELGAEGREVVLVSSGSIAMGSHLLGWDHPGRSIREKQAAAAVGQISLSELWRRHFRRHGREVGQVLVTRGGLEHRERYLNARHTLTTLLSLGVVPVVNENDTVATDEIRFGDNDNLSATVVNLVAADLLVLLTDVEGLYPEPPEPGKRPRGKPLDVVAQVDDTTLSRAAGSGNAFGRGGMITKLEAARSAAAAGAATVICNGRRKGTLLEVARGEPVGTLFRADGEGARMASRKHWLAFTAKPRGSVVLDAGAVRAVVGKGRSLLPAGVVSVRGRFGVGDTISCLDDDGRELARGLTAYDSADVTRIQGHATREIDRVLGYSNGDEVIHRDDLVLLDAPETAKTPSEKSAR